MGVPETGVAVIEPSCEKGEPLRTGPTGRSLAAGVERDLSQFDPGDFDRGASLPKVAAWFALNHLVFMAWWLPKRARPPILRWFGAVVGDHVDIRERVYIHFPWKLSIGKNCAIGRETMIVNHAHVSVGNDCMLSQRAFVSSGNHDMRTPGLNYRHKPIVIGDGVWVCARASVGPGAQIGDNAVVAMGTAVFGKVPPGVVFGVSGDQSKGSGL